MSLPLLGLALAGCHPKPLEPFIQAPDAVPSITPSVTPTASAPTKAGLPEIYPDPALTPGDVLPNVSEHDVCVPGYASHTRHVTAATKRHVFATYRIVPTLGAYEIDHFISLELGGSNDARNLWPEPYDALIGAHQKDRVEDHLHREVCAGRMTLRQAQEAMVADWYAVYLQMEGKP